MWWRYRHESNYVWMSPVIIFLKQWWKFSLECSHYSVFSIRSLEMVCGSGKLMLHFATAPYVESSSLFVFHFVWIFTSYGGWSSHQIELLFPTWWNGWRDFFWCAADAQVVLRGDPPCCSRLRVGCANFRATIHITKSVRWDTRYIATSIRFKRAGAHVRLMPHLYWHVTARRSVDYLRLRAWNSKTIIARDDKNISFSFYTEGFTCKKNAFSFTMDTWCSSHRARSMTNQEITVRFSTVRPM